MFSQMILINVVNRYQNHFQCYGIRLKTDSQNLMSLINQWNVSHLYIHE